MITGNSGTILWENGDDQLILIHFPDSSDYGDNWNCNSFTDSFTGTTGIMSGLGGTDSQIDWHCCPDWMALIIRSGGTQSGIITPKMILSRLSALTAIWGQNSCGSLDWLENSDSSVSLDDRKLAQLIGIRQKLETRTASQIFSSQIPPDFPASLNIRSIAGKKEKTTRVPKNPNRLFSLFLNYPAQ